MKKTIKAVLVDDEKHSLGVLQILLESHCPEVEINAVFEDSIEALSYLSDNTPDIVFIDIEMPRLNGFELLEKLGQIKFKPVIISAYDQFGIKAVKHNIFDYLVKPIDPIELKKTISRYLIEINSENNNEKVSKFDDRILLPIGSEFEFVKIDNIIRCESDSNYTHIMLDEGKSLLISKTLKTIEEALPSNQFLRVHNKHLINVDFVKKYIKTDGGFFQMEGGTEVPLSRYRKEEVLTFLGLR